MKILLILPVVLAACTNMPNPDPWSTSYDRGYFGADKIKHAGAGAVVSVATEAIISMTDINPVAFDVGDAEVRWSCVTAVAVGIAKEVWDVKRGSGYYEVADAVYTGGGGCAITWNF